MATLKGVNRTKADSGASASGNITLPGQLAGKVRTMIDKYVILGTESDGDVIEMGKKLPKNCTVIEQQLSCNASVAGTVTADVGDAEVTDRYMAGVDLSSAIINRIDEPDTGAGYLVDETDSSNLDSQILITLNTMTTPVADTIITLITTYAQE